jgi:hypothetical protein
LLDWLSAHAGKGGYLMASFYRAPLDRENDYTCALKSRLTIMPRISRLVAATKRP